MDYRREVDGLRAVAVLPVVFFHAGFEAFSGGFVGVDVFFVISGYLITSIILSDLRDGRFRLLDFWERRARRILPALFTVAFACLPLAWLWLLPSDMQAFSGSLMSVAVFSSNIFFWLDSDYFGPAAELKPLLHTWSLAVEEQYYLLFPFLLIAVGRLGGRWTIATLGALAVASLALAHWGTIAWPAAAFYLLPTRAWELLAGALVAVHVPNGTGRHPGRIASELGSAAGLLMILCAILAYDKGTVFPGVYALLPTLGAMLVIVCASRNTMVGRLLGTGPLVGIGLISYSAYLWHQPLFAFARHRSLNEPGWPLLSALTALTLILAYLTWKFVETPFRRRQRFSRRQIVVSAVSASLAALIAGCAGYVTDGFAHRYSGGEAEVRHRLRGNFGLGETCDGIFVDRPECRTAEDPEILVWGDSYAMHLVPGFLASRPDLKLMQATLLRCAPTLGVAERGAEHCIESNDRVLAFLQNNRSIRYVVLASPFYRFEDDSPVVLRDGSILRHGADATYAGLQETLEKISALGKTAVIFAPPPRNGTDLGACLRKTGIPGRPRALCDFTPAAIPAGQQQIYRRLATLRGHRVIWLRDGICDDTSCRASVGDVLIYRDPGHLSYEGSAWLGRKMDFYGQTVGTSDPHPD